MPISANFTSAFNCRSTNCSGACSCDNLLLGLPLSLTLFRLSPGLPRLRFRGSEAEDWFWMGDRVVDCARLESVCAERHRGFESPPIRSLGIGVRPAICITYSHSKSSDVSDV